MNLRSLCARAAWPAAVLVLLLVLPLAACDHTERLVVDDDPAPCAGQDSPAAVIASLIEAYNERDIELYARLLHPEFIFRFQDGDEPPELGREFWTRDQDSTGTAALFNSSRVADISVELDYDAAEPAAEIDLTHTMKVRAVVERLTVDDRDGTTYFVTGDIEDFFLLQGDSPDTCWYLVEWRDIPGYGGTSSPSDVQPGAARASSWGQLKALY